MSALFRDRLRKVLICQAIPLFCKKGVEEKESLMLKTVLFFKTNIKRYHEDFNMAAINNKRWGS